MTKRRSPAVAGLFYPDNPKVLKTTIETMLEPVVARAPAPRAIIAPHAGYVYSGPVAASVYASLSPVKRVVLLGPSHRVYCRGLALSSAEVFVTPLGDIPLDLSALGAIATLPQVQIMDAAHTQEHSLEVHLPFLQHCLGSFDLIPIVVGDTSPQEVAEVIDLLWTDDDTLMVVSTDLSHFLDYTTAVALDRQTTALIEACHQQLGPQQACGCRPVNGLLRVVEERGLDVSALDIRNSGDTTGGRDRVVGYGAFAVS